MRLKVYKANEVIFVEEKVCIILNGHVNLRNHAEKLDAGTLQAHYREGDVLGSNDEKYDRKLTVHPDSWLLTTSPTEVLFLEKADFVRLLSHQGAGDDLASLINISQSPLLARVSLSTLYMLYYEGIKIQSFRPGELIAKMTSRSVLNKDHYDFFKK